MGTDFHKTTLAKAGIASTETEESYGQIVSGLYEAIGNSDALQACRNVVNNECRTRVQPLATKFGDFISISDVQFSIDWAKKASQLTYAACSKCDMGSTSCKECICGGRTVLPLIAEVHLQAQQAGKLDPILQNQSGVIYHLMQVWARLSSGIKLKFADHPDKSLQRERVKAITDLLLQRDQLHDCVKVMLNAYEKVAGIKIESPTPQCLRQAIHKEGSSTGAHLTLLDEHDLAASVLLTLAESDNVVAEMQKFWQDEIQNTVDLTQSYIPNWESEEVDTLYNIK